MYVKRVCLGRKHPKQNEKHHQHHRDMRLKRQQAEHHEHHRCVNFQADSKIHQSIFSKGCCCKHPPNGRSRAATIASITGLCPILRSQPAEHHEHHWSVLLPHGSDTELFMRTRYPTPCTSGGVCLAGTPTSQNCHYCVLGVRVQKRANGHQCQVHQRGVVFIGASLAPTKSSSHQNLAWFSRTVRRQHHVHLKDLALQETPKA